MNAVEKNECACNQAQPASAARGYITPGVNILETPEAYVLEAEMPGVNKSGLEINVEDDVLTLVGRRAADPEGAALYRETALADYRRVFELDPSVETAGITARIDQGVLSITLPKAEKARPQRITVS
jgi:HSP20 family protein